MYTIVRTSLLGAALAAALAAPAAAQVPLTPRGLGMGAANLALARGHDALFLNPANLGLPGNPHWSVALPQVAGSLTLVGPRFGDLPDLKNYDDVSQQRRDELLARIPAAGTQVATELRAPLFVMQSRRVSLGVAYAMIGDHTVSKDLVDLILNDYDEGRTDYAVKNTSGRRASFWDVALGFGHAVGPLSVGVTGHYYRGGTLLQSRMFEPRYDLPAEDLEVDYVSVMARGGSGYGVDVGLALQPLPALSLSAAVRNAFSRMQWTKTLRYRSITFNRADFTTVDNPVDLLSRYENSEQELDATAVPATVAETLPGLYDEAYFPATLQLGGAWRLPSHTDLAASYQAHLTGGRLGAAWDRSLNLGVQQKLPLVTLRAGYATNLQGGAASGTLLTGGASLGVLHLGVGKYSNGEFGGGAREGWVGTFGVSVSTKTVMP